MDWTGSDIFHLQSWGQIDSTVIVIWDEGTTNIRGECLTVPPLPPPSRSLEYGGNVKVDS